MAKLPEIKWVSWLMPNPDRRWWQFWKSRFVQNPAVTERLLGRSEILNDIPWKELQHD